MHNGFSMMHDGAWLFSKLRKGYTVVDIGFSSDVVRKGLWYGTEEFVNIDTLSKISHLLSTNIYSYCGNNPLILYDPNGHIDRDAIREYIDEYANAWYAWHTYIGGRNKDFYSYRTDCANFTSQCMFAGGIKMNDEWHSYYEEITAQDGYTFRIYTVSNAWNMAAEQYKYFSNPQNGYINGNVLKFSHSEISDYAEHGNIQVGDLMYFSDGIDTLPYHSTIVSKVDEKNIYYAAHTNERKDYALSNVDKNTWFFVVRIFDNAS